MRIAILTFHRSYNCGAMLQAWALQTVLARMGHKVEFPNCGYPYGLPRWRISKVPLRFSLRCLKQLISAVVYDLFSIGVEDLSRYRYVKFIRKFLNEERRSERDFDQYYDLAVSGSDQVWNLKLAKQRGGLFLGETVPAEVKMISYAASCGDVGLRSEDERRVVSALNRFEYISVRERILQQQLEPLVSKRVFNDVDPTLLLTASDYEQLPFVPGKRSRPYLYVYTLSATRFVMETARAIAERLAVDVIITPVYQSSCFRAPRGLTYGVSPERMVGYMRGASFVLAASFHGTALALLHHKSFLSLREKKDEMESRPASLLNQIGIGARLVDPSVGIDEMVHRILSPLPDSAYVKLSQLREDSIGRLKNALDQIGARL